MAFDNAPLSDYYCLKDRNSLAIDPERDKQVYFGATALNDRIVNRVENDFVQPRGVPKFFVYGSYGSGKTHTLLHIQYVLQTRFREMYPTEPIYLDIAPLVAKEKFERIHGRLVDAVGLDRIRAAVEAVADASGAKDKVEAFMSALRFGDQALRASQANVFRNLLFGGRQAQLSWEWLKGRKVSVDEAQTLNTQKSLTEPQDYVWCLLNIGALHFKGTGTKLVFLIDEAEAFRAVTNPDSQTELKHCLRLILENANNCVGTVMAIQAEGGQESVGEFFSSDDIMRRVDYAQGYIDLNGQFAPVENSRAFMTELLSYLVDRDKASQLIQSEKLNVDVGTFPFEEQALEALSAHAASNPEQALPAAIISWMSNAAIEGWRRRFDFETHQLVTADIVETVLFPEG